MTVTDSPASGSASEFFTDGTNRALAMNNRGPLRFTGSGEIHPDILAAYWEHGFYVFEQVIDADELAEARADIDAMLDRAPYPSKASPVDRHGEPWLGHDLTVHPWHMAAPLTDPMGGTAANNGRHPFKMNEPSAQVEGPAEVPYMVSGCLQHSESYLRIYGHPGLLAMAEAVNGPGFTPFTDVLFVKEPGLGPSVAWHQDGQIHWDNPDWDEGIHGFNFQVQLYGSTAENGVWVVPGTHKMGKVDIKAMLAEAGMGERLPQAVPLVCNPGDCTMVNRQALHGSFANSSPDRRVTVNFGFHRYSSVIGQKGKLSGDGNHYTSEYVGHRCQTIPLAIAARAARFPNETPYRYQPVVEIGDALAGANPLEALRDYNVRDLGI